MLIPFPQSRHHVRASSAASTAADTGRKKASIGTSQPDNSLSRLASPKDASLRPAKILRMWDSEHWTDAATAGTVIPLRSAQTSMGWRSDITPSISTRNIQSQPEIFPPEIVNSIKDLIKCDMGRSPLKRKPVGRHAPSDQSPKDKSHLEPLYVGDWIEACGKDQKEVVKATKISQSYISNMSGGRRNNPSALKLRKIAKFLGVNMEDLYQPAPTPEHLKTLRGLSEAAKLALVRSKNGDDT